MSAKKIQHDLPPNKNGHSAYIAAWRAKTGKKYPRKPAAKLAQRLRENKPKLPVKPAIKPRVEPNERPRFPRSCGVRAKKVSGRNQLIQPNVIVDRKSKTIAEIEAKFAEIDRRLGKS